MSAIFVKYMLGIIFIFLLIISACQNNGIDDEARNVIANCLAEKNVKEYGAFWCPNCAKQKKLFGPSYEIILQRGVYIECDPRCKRDEGGKLPIACGNIEGEPELCLEKNVDKYPDWEFPDVSRLIGVQDLEVLAQKAGC